MNEKKEPLDITEKSSHMRKNEAILYRNNSADEMKGHYRGMTKTERGSFWIAAWVRQVKGQRVIELKFTPIQED
jgi:hypothetical protein